MILILHTTVLLIIYYIAYHNVRGLKCIQVIYAIAIVIGGVLKNFASKIPGYFIFRAKKATLLP